MCRFSRMIGRPQAKTVSGLDVPTVAQPRRWQWLPDFACSRASASATWLGGGAWPSCKRPHSTLVNTVLVSLAVIGGGFLDQRQRLAVHLEFSRLPLSAHHRGILRNRGTSREGVPLDFIRTGIRGELIRAS